MQFRFSTAWASLIGVATLVVCLRDVRGQSPVPARAQRPPDPTAPITIDQETFAHYFTFGLESEMARLVATGMAGVELKLREISADDSITEDQLDRIRMAGYAEQAAEARQRLDTRRAIVGKEFPDLGAAQSEFDRAAYSSYSRASAKKSLRQAVYDQVLTDQQKRNHKIFLAERRGRLARACIVMKVSLLSQQLAMTQAQRVALAKLINKQMPPAGLYEDGYTGSVVTYALALVPPEELEPLFDANQLKVLKPTFEEGIVDVRETLRPDGTLGRITAYRDALERSAATPAEEGASQPEKATPASP